MVVEQGITVGGKPLKDHLEAVDHFAVLGYTRALARQADPLTEIDVRNLHRLLMLRSDPEVAGRDADQGRYVLTDTGRHGFRFPSEVWDGRERSGISVCIPRSLCACGERLIHPFLHHSASHDPLESKSPAKSMTEGLRSDLCGTLTNTHYHWITGVLLGGMVMPHTGLAVVESRWWADGNDTVRPLFETLAGIVENNPHSVRYDMFVEEASLSKIISDVANKPDLHSVYIGAHGDDASICGLGDAKISRTVLRNLFRKANHAGSIVGLYFGSCLVANEKNASFWLMDKPTTGLGWIAGYTTSVDWIDSSAVDMIFWTKYLSERRINRGRKKGKKSEIDMVKHASSQMKKLMPSVFNELGFNIYYLDAGGALAKVW